MNNNLTGKNRIPLVGLFPMLALVAVGASLVLASIDDVNRDGKLMIIDRKMELSKGGVFRFSVPVGAVKIENHDEGFVAYHGEFEAKNEREADRIFPFLEEKSVVRGNRTELVIQWRNNKAPRKSNLRGEHVLRIPRSVDIEIITAGGSIVAGDRGGAVDVQSSGGSIKVGEVQGILNARTSGGSIVVGDCHGNAVLNTSGGSINTGHVHGSLAAQTSGGSINVGTIAGHVEAKTSGGNISASLSHQIQKPVGLYTSGGNINLKVKSDFRATLDAKTSGGRVVCDLPMKVSGKFSKKMIVGAVNGGGPKITMRTSGGNIRLTKF